MLAESAGALWELACRAGRGAGVRATEGRFFTGRRSGGGATGFGGSAFFLATILRLAGFLALAILRPALRTCGRLPFPPFPDLPLAMPRVPLSIDSALSHKGWGLLQFDI